MRKTWLALSVFALAGALHAAPSSNEALQKLVRDDLRWRGSAEARRPAAAASTAKSKGAAKSIKIDSRAQRQIQQDLKDRGSSPARRNW